MKYDGEVRWLPVSSVAKTLSVSRQRVYALINQSKLSAIKVDDTVLVSSRSVSMRLLEQAFELGRSRRIKGENK